jgi:hypothetical protein
MTILRPYDPTGDSDLARAERTATDLRELLTRLDRSGIAVGKLVSGWAGHLTLAGDIEVGVEQDADQGDAIAQENLATAYAKGEGVPKDEEEAKRWRSKVAAPRNVYKVNSVHTLSNLSPAAGP